MFELKEIGYQVLVKHKDPIMYFTGCIIDVKPGGYVVELEERAGGFVGEDRLVDLECESEKWELWERMF